MKSGVVKLVTGSAERGDLVGIDGNFKWHAFEAKGRTHWPPSSLVKKAKSQAQRIALVNGMTPKTHCACITTLISRPIQVQLIDPPETDPHDRLELQTDIEGFFREYYSPVSALRAAGLEFSSRRLETHESVEFRSAPLGDTGIHFGIQSSLYEHATNVETTWTPILRDFAPRWNQERMRINPESRAGVGLDGFAVFVE